MLRVGLTGGLGSGKSTAAGIFASLGAQVFQADAIGRELMQPGQAVYDAVVAHFGLGVVLPDGSLNRPELARISFAEGRVEELNAIVHPAVIDRQAELAHQVAERYPHAVVIIESALIFETNYTESPRPGTTNIAERHARATPWHRRFDRIIAVTAPDELKVARFVARMAQVSPNQSLTSAHREDLESEAYRRLARQLPDDRKTALADYVLTNDGSLRELEWQIDQLWPILQSAAREPR